MSQAGLKLIAEREIVFPGEAAEFAAVLCNLSEDDLPLAPDVWNRVTVKVAGPEKVVHEFTPFSDARQLPEGRVLYAGGEPERRFSLGSLIPGFGPGAWHVTANTTFEEMPLKAPMVSIEVLAPGPLSVAVQSPLGEHPRSPSRFWMARKAPDAWGLFDGSLTGPDPDTQQGWSADSQSRRLLIRGECRGLVTVAGPSEWIAREQRWVAWIDEQRLCFGVTAWLFESSSVQLSGDIERVIPRLLLRDSGGVDALVLTSGSPSLTVVRTEPPVARAPDPASTEEDVEALPVVMPAPRELVRHPLPWKATSAACARGWNMPGGSIGVLLAADGDGAIELHYMALDSDGSLLGQSSQRIDEARLIEGADPVLAIDRQGRARATILHASSTGAVLGVTCLAFGAGAEPLVIEGIRRERICELPARAIEAAISAVGDPSNWKTTWCVLMEDSTLLALAVNGTPIRLAPPEGMLRPLTLVADRFAIGLAVQSAKGIVGFALPGAVPE